MIVPQGRLRKSTFGGWLDLWRAAVDRAQFMGFKWIKLQLSWKELEPDAKGTFTQQFSVLADHSVYAARRGFKILLSIAKAPDWARPANARGRARFA